MDRLAMGCDQVGLFPRDFELAKRGGIGMAEIGEKLFKRIEPGHVIIIAAIQGARLPVSVECCAEAICPFRPGEMAAMVQMQRDGEKLGVPGFGKAWQVGWARCGRGRVTHAGAR